MAATIKVTVSRTHGVAHRASTQMLTETFVSADSHPSAEVLNDCLRQVTRKFVELHGRGSVESNIDVK
jgi:hypothetical protein